MSLVLAGYLMRLSIQQLSIIGPGAAWRNPLAAVVALMLLVAEQIIVFFTTRAVFNWMH